MYGETKERSWTKKNVTIYLEPEDILALDNIAHANNTSRTKLIESIIAQYAKELNDEVKNQQQV